MLPPAMISSRYGAETKRLKLDGGCDLEELIQKFREKFSLKPDDMPHKGALYVADEEFRDVTYEMEDADDLYNGAVVEWKLPERKRRVADLTDGLARRATASGKLAMQTPGVMAAIAAKKEADMAASKEKMQKEQAEAKASAEKAKKEQAEAEAAQAAAKEAARLAAEVGGPPVRCVAHGRACGGCVLLRLMLHTTLTHPRHIDRQKQQGTLLRPLRLRRPRKRPKRRRTGRLRRLRRPRPRQTRKTPRPRPPMRR